jgi:uncharacterized protein YxjI
MGLLRDNDGPEGRRFQMRQDMFSIGDDYWIEDEAGAKAFRVNGKAMRARETWVLEDPHGNEVAQIREKRMSIRDAIKIKLASGHEAVVKKEMVSIRDKFHVEVDGGDDLTVKGKIGDHEYKIERKGDKIAEVSKKWFRVRDTYGVEIENAADAVLLLAVTVAVDALARK